MEIGLLKQQIFTIRGYPVMFDFHLATLYQVETRVLKQAVKRNIFRFPSDFMFQLTKAEWQEVITNCDNLLPETAKFSPSIPSVLTEQGVAMLTSVLKSKPAVEVNISIMRAFVVLRQHLNNYQELSTKISELETEMEIKFNDINQALRFLLQKEEKSKAQMERSKIGFIQES